MAKRKPIVLYKGPSVLDGRPIVALATLKSKNEKTGPMVQIWIMRADKTPVRASKSQGDQSVCGNCPRRHALRGLRDALGKLFAADCYVLIHNAPQSSWKAWARAGKPDADMASAVIQCAFAADRHGVRLGAYGDPAAVPHTVWQTFLADCGTLAGRTIRHTGYTHQWRSRLATTPHRDWCRENLMASCDNASEFEKARSLGWRGFVAIQAGSPTPQGTIECLADRDGSRKTCETCGICDGSQNRPQRTSVYIFEHGALSGAKAKRSAALAVLA